MCMDLRVDSDGPATSSMLKYSLPRSLEMEVLCNLEAVLGHEFRVRGVSVTRSIRIELKYASFVVERVILLFLVAKLWVGWRSIRQRVFSR